MLSIVLILVSITHKLLFFFFVFCAECQILVISTTWNQRRVDKISLTIDYNKRKQKRVKNVIRDMLPIWNSAIQCIDFAIDPSQIMGFFFFGRMSNFGHVIYYMAPTKGG